MEDAGSRAGADKFARRRKIWTRRIQIFRRLAWRGAKCTNALSEWFKAEVSRDGKVYHMAFARGKTTDKLTVIGEVKNKKTTGTLITFLPDPTIFAITTEFKFERLAARLRELAFLNPGLEITLTDERA